MVDTPSISSTRKATDRDMWIDLFLRGLLIGVTASLPLGPVAILCIQRTLSKDLRSGFVSGLGAASADMIYAAMAFFSLSFAQALFTEHATIVKLVGGVCIATIGIHIFLTNPEVQIRRNRSGKGSLWQDFLSVFGVTLANPTYILIYVTLFATFGLSNDIGELKGMAMLTGVFAGCAGWWLLLTSLINLLRSRFTIKHLRWLNRISGGVIASLGTITLLSTLFNLYIEYIDELF